jgi:hypothetical protein
MTFKDLQCQHIEYLIHHTDIFSGDPGENNKSIRKYCYMLRDGVNSLYEPYRQKMLDYLWKNGIAWWGGSVPTTNPLSSQVACLNHLFPFREDAEAALAIARKISPDIVRVLPIETDCFMPAFIQFEAVSQADHLNEGCKTRGSNCTSMDALIYAQRADGQKLLLTIEWKYTEVYGNDDKGEGPGGQTRKNRYDGLISQSKQLLPVNTKVSNVYYFEPFYQLMRQTLWAEQMVEHRAEETLKADDFIHVHVVPCGNDELLRRNFPCSHKMLESTWRGQLRDQTKYWLICPEYLLSQIDGPKYGDVFQYLQTRYW